MVLTSHDQLGNTGLKTGIWLEEFAAPYFVFRDAGVELTLASPKGGPPPIDPKSDMPENQTPAMTRYKKDAEDLADEAELMQIRHFLEDSSLPAPAPAAAATHLLVVIDHHEARVYSAEVDGTVPKRIVPYDPFGFGRSLRYTPGRLQRPAQAGA
jgi:hypothetical protein